jgi:P-type Cu+ transporter
MPQTHAQSQPSTKLSSKDPVCGMDVNPETAAGHAEHAGQTYHFCSRSCVAKFEADPEKYVGPAKAPVPSGTSGQYTCPMHPEVRQAGPGACPKCGMALEPVTIALVATRTEYTCPMHPEIIRDAPGSCPICGMALEPKTMIADEGESAELVDMRRRFWVSTVLSVPVLISAMGESLLDLHELASPQTRTTLRPSLQRPSCSGVAGHSSCAPCSPW